MFLAATAASGPFRDTAATVTGRLGEVGRTTEAVRPTRAISAVATQPRWYSSQVTFSTCGPSSGPLLARPLRPSK